MTRRGDIVAIKEDATLRDLLDLSATSRYSRIPTYREDVKSITGIISIPKIIPFLTNEKNLDKSIKEFAPHRAYKIPESKILDDLFFEFQKKRVHMAVVVDEFGETSGLITLEDIVEEIFGDIEDETDEIEVKIRKNVDGEVFCDSSVTLAEVFKFFQYEQEEASLETYLNKTLSGLILDTLHRFPKEGEKIVLKELGISLVVINMGKSHIHKVKVSLSP